MQLQQNLIHIDRKYNATWLIIFHHRVHDENDFFTDSEFEFSNSKNKFSLWGLITKDYRVDGYYEFLLEYPHLEGYNSWKQSKYPLDVNESVDDGNYNGYLESESDIKWNGSGWHGLSKSNHIKTILDGCKELNHFWFSIGAKANYSDGYGNMLIPGPSTSEGKGEKVNEVAVYLRILNYIYLTCNQNSQLLYQHFFFTHLYLFLIKE